MTLTDAELAELAEDLDTFRFGDERAMYRSDHMQLTEALSELRQWRELGRGMLDHDRVCRNECVVVDKQTDRIRTLLGDEG